MSLARRVVGTVAVALVAVLGLLVLSQSAAAFAREERCPRAVAEAKLVEEAVAPKYAPGLGWSRRRGTEVPEGRPEERPALAVEAPVADRSTPAGVPDAPYGARRQSRAAVLQVFRC